MYAIIETGSKQYKVQPGQVLDVELTEATGDKVTFDRVLLLADGKSVTVGSPTVAKASVTASLLGEVRGDKVYAFKKKRRKDSQRTRGHRQNYLRVRIDEITAK